MSFDQVSTLRILRESKNNHFLGTEKYLSVPKPTTLEDIKNQIKIIEHEKNKKKNRQKIPNKQKTIEQK